MDLSNLIVKSAHILLLTIYYAKNIWWTMYEFPHLDVLSPVQNSLAITKCCNYIGCITS